MITAKYRAAMLAILLTTGTLNIVSAADDEMGLIIPMPGKKAIEKASSTLNIQQPPVSEQKKPVSKGSEVYISLPTRIEHKKAEPAKTVASLTSEVATSSSQVLHIQLPKPVEASAATDAFPAPPDEVTISSGEEIGDLLPPPPPPEVAVGSEGAAGQTMPVFPKDTSSAIFMVMKTWQAQDYDGATLLKHAIEVYGKEADDVFQVQGLEEGEGGFKINVEEEDITLDELLDIVAMKAGRDWGVDIPSRTIYFYPKGVKTDNFNVW